jgi:hypothetical protein
LAAIVDRSDFGTSVGGHEINQKGRVMTFIETIPEAQATGKVAEMYEADREAFAGLPNFTKAFSGARRYMPLGGI